MHGKWVDKSVLFVLPLFCQDRLFSFLSFRSTVYTSRYNKSIKVKIKIVGHIKESKEYRGEVKLM